MEITLNVTDGDVDMLIVDDVLWHGYREDWLEQQKGEYPRFRLFNSETISYIDGGVNLDYTYGLFVSEWSHVMIIRAFLFANGYDIQILSDEADGDWCILTNYERLYRRKTRTQALDSEAPTD